MSEQDQLAITVGNVEFSYGSLNVLNGLSLEISYGEIFGILGANGAGKTTLMRLLMSLSRPSAGRIQVLGQAPSPKLADRVGYMPQLNALYLELTVQQNVDFFARMYGMSDRAQRRAAVESALKAVALWERRSDSILRLSGGMRQRVSLAISLVHSPKVLVLDEPTVGLDPELRASFWDRFRGMAESGTTIVISSHTMDDAAHCDRLAFIQSGSVVAQGNPTELRQATGRPDATLEDAFLHFVKKGKS